MILLRVHWAVWPYYLITTMIKVKMSVLHVNTVTGLLHRDLQLYAVGWGFAVICKREWDLCDMQAGKELAVIYKREWDLCDMQAGMGFAVICKLEWDLQ